MVANGSIGSGRAVAHGVGSAEQTAIHDQRSGELARYKLSPITSHDPAGYHRVSCPAAQGKLRCPHKPASLTLPNDRPTVLKAPEHPPVCCTQETITVPPTVNAKTAQKHDYPSPAHRASYNRRTAAERTFATLTDRATNDPSRGWCRKTGLTDRAAHRHRADRPQHPRDRRVHRPPNRESAPSLPRAPAQNTHTPPHHDPRPHRNRTRPLTRPAATEDQPNTTASQAPIKPAPPPHNNRCRPPDRSHRKPAPPHAHSRRIRPMQT